MTRSSKGNKERGLFYRSHLIVTFIVAGLLAVIASIIWLSISQSKDDTTTSAASSLDNKHSALSQAESSVPPRHQESLTIDAIPSVMPQQVVTSANELFASINRLLQEQEFTPKQLDELVELFTQAASQEGSRTMELLMQVPHEAFKRQVFPLALEAWANSKPLDAINWYHAEEQDHLAQDGYQPNDRFYTQSFHALAKLDMIASAQSLPVVEGTRERLAAVQGMINYSREVNRVTEMASNLGEYGGLEPVELALINAALGDQVGYEELRANLDAESRFFLDEQLGINQR